MSFAAYPEVFHSCSRTCCSSTVSPYSPKLDLLSFSSLFLYFKLALLVMGINSWACLSHWLQLGCSAYLPTTSAIQRRLRRCWNLVSCTGCLRFVGFIYRLCPGYSKPFIACVHTWYTHLHESFVTCIVGMNFIAGFVLLNVNLDEIVCLQWLLCTAQALRISVVLLVVSTHYQLFNPQWLLHCGANWVRMLSVSLSFLYTIKD